MARGDGALARGAGSPHRAGAGRGGVRLLCFVFFPDLKSSQLGELRSGSQNVTPNEVAPSNPGENLALSARREFCLCGRCEAADQERTVPCAGSPGGYAGGHLALRPRWKGPPVGTPSVELAPRDHGTSALSLLRMQPTAR